MRNKLKWLGSFLLVALLLFGCSVYDDEGNANPPEENDNVEEDGSRENVEEIAEAPYPFLEFEVEVDIDGVNDAFEVEYEVKRNKTKASYDDKTEDVYLKDDEAMKKIEPIFDTFTFDEDSLEDDIYEQIIEGFSIDNYDEIEIEIRFKDMTEIEFER